jgi:[protein-PII] uridylyltransferase
VTCRITAWWYGPGVSLRVARQSLLDNAHLHGDDFCRAYAAAADEFLTALLRDAADGDLTDLALVAVGGYGRGALAPFSDLDVVLVHKGRRDVATVADAVWYPVWDEGIRLDHAVRRPNEVVDIVTDDLRAQLGWLDARLVAGDEELFGPLRDRTHALWRDRAPRWLVGMAHQVEERHRKHGDVAFLLEPDLKEAHGGLRDTVVVDAMTTGVPALAEQIDAAALRQPRHVLDSARVELHRATGRATDVLLLQEQDEVARLLDVSSADELMKAIAEAGRAIAWVSDDAWRRRALWEPVGSRRRWGGRPSANPRALIERRIEPGVAILVDPDHAERGAVVLGPGARPAEDPALALRVAVVAAELALPIDRGTLDTLAEQTPGPADPWTPDVRTALVRVLAAGRPAIAALESLDQRGLMARVLPEWAAVRNRPQRNAYHRFTVDRHLLETAAEAAPLALGVARPDLLLVSALLHDIGKGYPGDHTEEGQTLVRTMARRMGFPPEDVDTLVELVRLHLLLPDTATRRDLDDPGTIEAVVAEVGDRGTLELLAALTEADSLATGPAAWGSWKAGLVADLVRRTRASLAGEAITERATSLVTDRHRALMQQVGKLGRSIVVADGPLVTVVAGDRRGLLAAVTGVLAMQGLDVRSANVASEGDYAVEVFTVEPARDRWPDWGLVSDELEAVLRGRISVEARLAERARTYSRTTRRASARPITPQVSLDNRASASSTVVEVRAADAVGLLHRVTSALFESGLDVVAARVSTLGAEVVDAFYVREERIDGPGHGSKVTDPDRIRTIDQAVMAAVGTLLATSASPG